MFVKDLLGSKHYGKFFAQLYEYDVNNSDELKAIIDLQEEIRGIGQTHANLVKKYNDLEDEKKKKKKDSKLYKELDVKSIETLKAIKDYFDSEVELKSLKDIEFKINKDSKLNNIKMNFAMTSILKELAKVTIE